METELNRLIEKIRREGVESAEKRAKEIVEKAEEKARGIIKDAEEKKDSIIDEGRSRAENFKKTSEKALKQAARDVLLTLRQRVTEFYGRIIKEKVAEGLDPDTIKDAIIKAVGGFGKEGGAELEAILNDKERAKLEKAILSSFKKEAKERLTIKGASNIDKGFRIGEKGKDSYIDFTDEAITEMFKRYLNPRLAELLDVDLGIGKGE
jgi:V/A-type H+-transporting ATPase subunit E